VPWAPFFSRFAGEDEDCQRAKIAIEIGVMPTKLDIDMNTDWLVFTKNEDKHG
jgi:hypothetical protein